MYNIKNPTTRQYDVYIWLYINSIELLPMKQNMRHKLKM